MLLYKIKYCCAVCNKEGLTLSEKSPKFCSKECRFLYVKSKIIGQKFNRLTIMDAHVIKSQKYAICLCDCGIVRVILLKSVRSGITKSCGCLTKEVASSLSKTRIKHGKTRRGEKPAIVYRAWASMIQRCTNPNDSCYHTHGARGVYVCDKWIDFNGFLEDMGEPSSGHSLHRINKDGPYTKDNCRWAERYQKKSVRFCKMCDNSLPGNNISFCNKECQGAHHKWLWSRNVSSN